MASDITQPDHVVPNLQSTENVEEDNTPTGGSSDGEGGERSARERLKKTSIAGLSQHSKSGTGGAVGDHPLAESITAGDFTDPSIEDGAGRGRPSKKRSFEDLQKDEQVGPTENGSLGEPDPRRSHHKRMRSRDVSGANGQEIGKFDEPASPVQEESDDGGPGGAGILVDAQTKADTNAQRSLEDKILEEEDTTKEPTVGVAPETGLPSVSVQESRQAGSTEGQKDKEATISPTSGFANVSSASPFGTVKSPPSTSKGSATTSTERAGTSTTAFKSSGLSAFASSEKSPFGASSTTQSSGGFGEGGSGFGGGSAPGFGGGKPSGFGSGSTGFGGTSSFGPKSTAGFGSTSGFGSTGASGGAAPRPFGGAISSFAGPAGGAGAFGKAKPFGAKDQADDDDEKSDQEDENGQQEDTDEKPDSRFQRQTGLFNSSDLSFTSETDLSNSRDWRRRGRYHLQRQGEALPL